MQTLSKTHPKALSETELQSYCVWIRERIQGAQLQDVRTDGRVLVLELYGQGPSMLVIDPQVGIPSFRWVAGNEIPNFKKIQKPLQLFLKSHAKNLALGELQMQVEMGRIVELIFVNRFKEVRLQIILIPRFGNVLAFAEGKSIAWSKPKEIPQRPEQVTEMGNEERDWKTYGQELFTPVARAESVAAPKDDRAKQIHKKLGAIEKLKATLISEAEHRWHEFGEALKIQAKAPAEFQDLWDSKLNLKDNRERAFHKSKEIRRKKTGTQARIEILEQEIQKLQSSVSLPPVATHRKGTQALRKTGSKGQTLNLESGAQAIVGKSAKDNLSILRQSRAWDLWLHLKDEPSAHGVIFREKNQVISENEINLVAQWILAKSKLAKNTTSSFRFEVLVVECRFVKPIKGDKLGRVTYNSPRVYSFASKLNP